MIFCSSRLGIYFQPIFPLIAHLKKNRIYTYFLHTWNPKTTNTKQAATLSFFHFLSIEGGQEEVHSWSYCELVIVVAAARQEALLTWGWLISVRGILLLFGGDYWYSVVLFFFLWHATKVRVQYTLFDSTLWLFPIRSCLLFLNRLC